MDSRIMQIPMWAKIKNTIKRLKPSTVYMYGHGVLINWPAIKRLPRRIVYRFGQVPKQQAFIRVYTGVLIAGLLMSMFQLMPTSAAVERTGSAGTITSSSNSGSQNVTVPADAEIIVFGASGHENNDTYFTSGTVTLGGSNLTMSPSSTDSD